MKLCGESSINRKRRYEFASGLLATTLVKKIKGKNMYCLVMKHYNLSFLNLDWRSSNNLNTPGSGLDLQGKSRQKVKY